MRTHFNIVEAYNGQIVRNFHAPVLCIAKAPDRHGVVRGKNRCRSLLTVQHSFGGAEAIVHPRIGLIINNELLVVRTVVVVHGLLKGCQPLFDTRVTHISADKADVPMSPGSDQMLSSELTPLAVVDQNGGDSSSRELIVDKDHGKTKGVDIFNETRVHFARDDDAVDISFKQKARHVAGFSQLPSDRSKENIEVVVARFEFRSEKDPRIERLHQGEMIVAEDEADVATSVGRQYSRCTAWVIAQLFDGS